MNREELLAKHSEPIKVGLLGHVRLVDVMGDDQAIVQAARVSYGAGTKKTNEDRGLIRYLMRHRHTSPIEMCEIKLHLKMPMHVARQWIRHRTASINEVSTRYSIVQDEFELYSADGIRLQSAANKQGSDGLLINAPALPFDADWKSFDKDGNQLGIEGPQQAAYLEHHLNTSIHRARHSYDEAINLGVAREQARNVLPLATYTEFYWKIDLHNLFHFLGLRMDAHAQLEIREFANAIAHILEDWVPIAYEAFVDYHLEGCYLSRQEITYLKGVLSDLNVDLTEHIDYMKSKGISGREAKEFAQKLQ